MEFYQLDYSKVETYYRDLISKHVNYRILFSSINRKLEHKPKRILSFVKFKDKEYWTCTYPLIVEGIKNKITVVYSIRKKKIICHCIKVLK